MSVDEQILDLENRISILFEKLALIKEQAKESYAMGKYASRGYVELHSKIEALRVIQEHMHKSISDIDQRIKNQEAMLWGITNRINRNVRWMVSTIITIILGIGGIFLKLILGY